MHFSSLQLAFNLLFQYHLFSYCSALARAYASNKLFFPPPPPPPSLPDPGTPLPTPILHNVTSEDIHDNGDSDTRNVTLRWTLSEPDNCLNTIYFIVTPDDPTHCGSCEVGPGDPVMQEEFSCQVMQGIGQSCTYRVTLYAARCGDPQSGVPSEPVIVHVSGMIQ